MKLLENILSPKDIQVFKKYWADNHQHAYVNGKPEGVHPGIGVHDHIDRRLLIKGNTQAYSILEKIVKAYFPDENYFWGNYQRQVTSHSLHVDEFGKDRPDMTYTIIFALDDRPKFKAIIFKELFNSCQDIEPYMEEKLKGPKISNISETEDLDHCADWRDLTRNYCDWLELEGIFTYKAGDAVLFDTNKIHVTSYWNKYPEFQSRDLVQIHIGTCAPSSYSKENQIKKGELVPDLTNVIIK